MLMSNLYSNISKYAEVKNEESTKTLKITKKSLFHIPCFAWYYELMLQFSECALQNKGSFWHTTECFTLIDNLALLSDRSNLIDTVMKWTPLG